MNIDFISHISGWFSVEQRMKQKRIKLEELKEKRSKIMLEACTDKTAQEVMKIDEQIKKIERDLRS